MKNKIIAVALIAVVLCGLGIGASAGDTTIHNWTITKTKEIRTDDVYYVDGVQVTKAEYDTAMAQGDTVEYVDICSKYNVDHETVYKINGQTVTLDEYNAMLSNLSLPTETPTTPSSAVVIDTPTTTPTKSTKELTFTSTEMSTAYNIGEIGDYLTFTTNGDNVKSATVKSSAVVGVKYNYSEQYMSFVDNSNNTYAYGCNGGIYQVVENGMTFTIGGTPNPYAVVFENNNVTVGYKVFSFVQNDNFSTITFENVFNSITLIIAED